MSAPEAFYASWQRCHCTIIATKRSEIDTHCPEHNNPLDRGLGQEIFPIPELSPQAVLGHHCPRQSA